MMRSLWSAASGMVSQQTNVDTIANNLANVNTTGYKTEKAEFKTLLYQTIKTETTTANGARKPVPAQVGLGTRPAAITTMFSQGAFLASESPTSFAIDGAGFFAVSGPDGQTYYTRNGDLKLALGGEGLVLTNNDGYPVLDTEGNPVTFENDIVSSRIVASNDGNFMIKNDDGSFTDLDIQIGLFQFNNPAGLNKLAGSIYAVSDASGEAINEALDKGGLGKNAGEGRVVFGKTTGKTLMVAGLCHDMGMCGEGYSLTEILGDDGKALRDENGNKMYEKTDAGLYKMHQIELDNFPEIRTSHSMNSALIVLMNRKAFNEAGLTDEEIDKISLECFAHSKSNSGVTDLNSVSSWTECFDRMDSLVAAYNADHADVPISFDRTPFEKDPVKLSVLAAETLALRVGDVSRDSAPEAEAHSGEAVYVERDTINDRGGSITDEVEGMTMTIGPNRDPVDGEKDRQVHSGEQNITDNHTIVNEDGILTHIITVNDGCSAPKCTQQAIDDHLGEFYSARDEEFIVKVEFTHFNDDEDGFFHDSYEEFRIQASQDYPSVTLLYPWD